MADSGSKEPTRLDVGQSKSPLPLTSGNHISSENTVPSARILCPSFSPHFTPFTDLPPSSRTPLAPLRTLARFSGDFIKLIMLQSRLRSLLFLSAILVVDALPGPTVPWSITEISHIAKEGKRLISHEDGAEPVWKTEDQVLELVKAGSHFVSGQACRALHTEELTLNLTITTYISSSTSQTLMTASRIFKLALGWR